MRSRRPGGLSGIPRGPSDPAAPLLPPSAGYPGSTAAGLDPLMGRGYLIGKQVQLAAGASSLIVNHGQQDHFFRWKITLGVTDVTGVVYPANTAAPIRFEVTTKSENERITRVCSVARGNAQVLYGPGRAIEVLAINESGSALNAEVGLDEATPGLASWDLFENLLAVAAETALDVPAFATHLQIYSPSADPGFVLRGYNTAGTLVYDEVLTAPRSAEVAIPSGLLFTIQNVGPGAQSGLVHYRCVG